jgi:hypothetical protein
VTAPPHASRLLTGAGKFAQSSWRARLDNDSAVSLLHAATALELLMKARLASLDASLIAAPNDFDSLLHLCGESRHARTHPSWTKTITMNEALKRVGQVEPAFRNHEAPLRLLAHVRNGVIHAGASEEDGEGVFTPFLRACELLIQGVPEASREALWGEFESSVDARLSESAQEAEIVAVEAIAAARLAFDRHYGAMEDAAKAAALGAIAGSYDVTKYEQSLTECPACGQQALTDGTYEVEWEADWDQEGSRGEPFIVGAYPIVTYRPGYLRCRVCGLELDGEEQLEAVGVEKSWNIEDADAADFYEEDDYER